MSTEVWLVSYGDSDDREMTPAQIGSALESGEITLQTIVWRDGMPTWLQIEKTQPLLVALGRAKPTAPRPGIPSPGRTQLLAARQKTIPGVPNAPSVAPTEARKRKVTAMGIGSFGLSKNTVSPTNGGPSAEKTPKAGAYRRLATPHPPIPRVTAAPPPVQPQLEFESEPETIPPPPAVEVKRQDPPVVPRGATRLGIGRAPKGFGASKAPPAPPPPPAPEESGPESLDEGLIDSIPPSAAFSPPIAAEVISAEADAANAAVDHIVEDTSADSPMFPSPPPMPTADDDAEPIDLSPLRRSNPPQPTAPQQPASILPLIAIGEEARGGAAGSVAAAEPASADQAEIPTPRAPRPIPAKLELVPETEALDGDALDTLPLGGSLPEAPANDAISLPAPESAPPTTPGKKTERKAESRGISPLVFAASLLLLFGAGYLVSALVQAPASVPTQVAAVPPNEPSVRADAPTADAPTAAPAPTASAESVATAPSAAAVEATDTSLAVAPSTARPTAATNVAGTGMTPSPAPMPKSPSVATSVATTPAPTAAPEAPAPAAPTTPAAVPPAGAGSSTFDRAAAATALGRSAMEAAACRQEGDPSGVAKVEVTFSPAGRAVRATVSGPPFAGTKTGSCIAGAMRRTTVPAFSGERVTVKKTVVIN